MVFGGPDRVGVLGWGGSLAGCMSVRSTAAWSGLPGLMVPVPPLSGQDGLTTQVHGNGHGRNIKPPRKMKVPRGSGVPPRWGRARNPTVRVTVASIAAGRRAHGVAAQLSR